jgi:UDP-glucose 4-epimerase
VISIFCERISAGEPIKILGDGQQTRDFIYVADVVGALLAGMSLRPADAPVFNVCTGTATSVEALARLIADLAGKNLSADTGLPRAGEIRHSSGIPELANTTLGLSERVPLRTGLANVLAWVNGSAG